MTVVIPSGVVVCHLVAAGTCHWAWEVKALVHSAVNADRDPGDVSEEASSDAVAVAWSLLDPVSFRHLHPRPRHRRLLPCL
jgi:hypothetical protein